MPTITLTTGTYTDYRKRFVDYDIVLTGDITFAGNCSIFADGSGSINARSASITVSGSSNELILASRRYVNVANISAPTSTLTLWSDMFDTTKGGVHVSDYTDDNSLYVTTSWLRIFSCGVTTPSNSYRPPVMNGRVGDYLSRDVGVNSGGGTVTTLSSTDAKSRTVIKTLASGTPTTLVLQSGSSAPTNSPYGTERTKQLYNSIAWTETLYSSTGVATLGGVTSGITYTDTSTETSLKSPVRAIFGYGTDGGSYLSMKNLVNNYGGVATDVTGVGTARTDLAAAGYGGDKAIFGYGGDGTPLSLTNLVSNLGVVANDTSGVGTTRYALAAASYGNDKAIFGFGTNNTGTKISLTNLVSNIGVVANDTSGVGTGRASLAAAGYGGDKAIFGYGYGAADSSLTNLVSNTGVVATDTAGVGTARRQLAAAGYGGDKAIFAYGYIASSFSRTNISNLVSNVGVVATDTTGVGTSRNVLAAAGYGGDKAIFAYGVNDVSYFNIKNLVSNTGVVATDTTGAGTARVQLAAASYSS